LSPGTELKGRIFEGLASNTQQWRLSLRLASRLMTENTLSLNESILALVPFVRFAKASMAVRSTFEVATTGAPLQLLEVGWRWSLEVLRSPAAQMLSSQDSTHGTYNAPTPNFDLFATVLLQLMSVGREIQKKLRTASLSWEVDETMWESAFSIFSCLQRHVSTPAVFSSVLMAAAARRPRTSTTSSQRSAPTLRLEDAHEEVLFWFARLRSMAPSSSRVNPCMLRSLVEALSCAGYSDFSQLYHRLLYSYPGQLWLSESPSEFEEQRSVDLFVEEWASRYHFTPVLGALVSASTIRRDWILALALCPGAPTAAVEMLYHHSRWSEALALCRAVGAAQSQL
jgi:hypothetical protein